MRTRVTAKPARTPRWAAPLAALAAGAALLSCGAARDSPPGWRALASGVDYVAIEVAAKSPFGGGRLHVVRVDPARARIEPRLATRAGGAPRTASAWCSDGRIVAAINAGMFDRDQSTHNGYFRVGDRVESPRWVGQYQSILLLGPRLPGLPGATIRDLQPGDTAASFGDYDTVIQNLRLIRDPAVNVWAANERRWSEAAIALDKSGRILLVFYRAPSTMRDFNALLTRLPLDVVRAMHVEGGPEASLSVRGPGIHLDLAGSYETGIREDASNDDQWPLPNVLVVMAAPAGR